MPTPQITYNGRTITFPFYIYAFQPDYPRNAIQNFAASAVAEVLNVAPDVMVSLAARWLENANATHATFKRNMFQFFEWAAQGQPWQIALDNTKTAKTSIVAGANAGDSSIVVASTTGLAIGDQCVLRNTTALQLVKIQNIVGTTITLVETLDYIFTNGSTFRHENYWPGRLLTSVKHVIQEKPPLHFDIEMQFVEDVN
jgi:hypothetical protein